jgi:glycosyltransferase involved in cell wall biosynthesis
MQQKDTKMKKISIVIPCFNESRTIKEVLNRLSYLSAHGWEKEIVIVDDGSTDGTRDILKGYEKEHAIVYHEKNAGKGTAVKTGLARATGDYVLIQDADLEYHPSQIPALLEAIDRGDGDVIYGSRNLQKEKHTGGLIPRFGVWLMTKKFNLLYRANLTDIWTCYKLFPRKTSHLFTSGGFESEISFSAKLRKNKYRIAEVSIAYSPRTIKEGKKIKYRDGIKGLWVIFKERFI